LFYNPILKKKNPRVATSAANGHVSSKRPRQQQTATPAMSASYCHINSIAMSTAHCHVSSALPRHHHVSTLHHVSSSSFQHLPNSKSLYLLTRRILLWHYTYYSNYHWLLMCLKNNTFLALHPNLFAHFINCHSNFVIGLFYYHW
jgi:hypothetical protein